MESADIILMSGGISVGDFDFTARALKNNGIREIFHKVSQKPGKPLFYGVKDRLQVFGLPGNPYAALLCFYEYVLPVLNTYSGKGFSGLQRAQLPLEHPYDATGDRALFLKAKASTNGVTILDRQSSAMLGSLAESNALVYIPVPKTLHEGDSVEVHFL
jgi:molybdopterin molybdotransferase